MRLLTTRELAAAIGVSESSLKRWVDAGKIAATRTEGGHRRIELAEAMRFIRASGSSVVRPDLLDLPELAAARSKQLVDLLRAGDNAGARGWLLARYLEGRSIAQLADGPIREAMHELGELWRHDASAIYVEHRATEACIHAVAHLRGMLSEPPETAPIALGAAPTDDLYLLPSQLVAMSLVEVGMQAVNLGADTPYAALAAAVAEYAPRLVWLSVTAPLASARARAYARWLESLPDSVQIVVGGQQASTMGALPARVTRVATLSQLATIGAGLVTRVAAN